MSKTGPHSIVAAACLFFIMMLAACAGPYQLPDPVIDARVSDLMASMTLEEKIGQMMVVGRNFITEPEDIATYGFGSIFSPGGSSPMPNTPEAWADMIDSYQRVALSSRLGIPMLYGIDAVHGDNNVRGAVIFPHNIGLGAGRSPDIVRRAARITALEMLATGARWDFAPCIAVPQDPRWGRTYEGFSSHAGLVGELGAAAIEGYQDSALGAEHTVLATAKHFAADGGTTNGVDEGNAVITTEQLWDIHLRPYKDVIGAGVQAVMASYSSINGVKDHGNKELLTGILRGKLHFKGILVSDYGAVRQLPGSPREQVKTAVNAGIDMVMLPNAYPAFLSQMLELVEDGEVPMTRVNEAVRRILTVKVGMGLFEHPFADRSLLPEVGSEEHREAAREAVRRSLVLLKNDRRTLPISRSVKRILVTGARADDLGSQCGGWTITWQGSTGNITIGTTILDGMREVGGESVTIIASRDGKLPEGEPPVDLVVLVIGETPYTEMRGDRTELPLSAQDEASLNAACEVGAPVAAVLISGRPLIVTEEIKRVDSFVAAWLPGTEGAGVADVLFGIVPFRGKLPVPWPRDEADLSFAGNGNFLFPFGWGLGD